MRTPAALIYTYCFTPGLPSHAESRAQWLATTSTSGILVHAGACFHVASGVSLGRRTAAGSGATWRAIASGANLPHEYPLGAAAASPLALFFLGVFWDLVRRSALLKETSRC